MAKKRRKKLTKNQQEYNRIIRNARAVYRRLERAGYQSDPSLKAMLWRDRPAVIRKRDLEKLQRELHYKKQYERFYGRVGEYGEAREYSRMTRTERRIFERGALSFNQPARIPGGVNTAELDWEVFKQSVEPWLDDPKRVRGWQTLKRIIETNWGRLRNKYGREQGDKYFSEILNELGSADFIGYGGPIDNPDIGRVWLTQVFSRFKLTSELRADIEDNF